ncbi:MAG: HAD family hydrolase [Elusimicrobia bacterium]|nr:HAD family hydrolase [Elusimicrobiota bacterium]
MAPTTTLLFDYGGTLDDDGRPWLDRFEPLWRAAGAAQPHETLVRAFYDADDNLAKLHDLSTLGLEETVRLQCADAGKVLLPGNDQAARQVADRFTADCRAALKKNRPLLQRLAARYKLGIVSNFYGNLEAILRSEGLLELFDAVADSAKVGREKPDPAIFNWALERLKAKPEEALMVGDSLKRDMAGAEAAGIPHAWLAGDKAEARACCPGTPVLRSFADLEPLLLGVPAR